MTEILTIPRMHEAQMFAGSFGQGIDAVHIGGRAVLHPVSREEAGYV